VGAGQGAAAHRRSPSGGERGTRGGASPRVEIRVKALTLYAFSAQNWLRPPEEVGTLMRLLREYVIAERAEIMDNAIRLVTIGDVDRAARLGARAARRPWFASRLATQAMILCLALVVRWPRIHCRHDPRLV